jgi:hypothetical protein
VGGPFARRGQDRKACKLLVKELEGNRPLGRLRRTWVDNIKMDLAEIECGGVNRIQLAQDRDQWGALVNAMTNFRVP